MKVGKYEVNQIYTGDARELSSSIPDESVDLIITDPPYLKEYLSLYGWLAATASRILKPGGFCFAYGGGEHLPNNIQQMSGHLNYYWLFILKHNGGWPRMWAKHLMSGYKPVMVYTKGKPQDTPWLGTIHEGVKDKRYHKWGQGAGFAIKMIDTLTEPGDIIFDPMVGGGMVPAACIETGRNFLGFEIDPDTADVARERIKNTPDPLPLVHRPVQEHLFVCEGGIRKHFQPTAVNLN